MSPAWWRRLRRRTCVIGEVVLYRICGPLPSPRFGLAQNGRNGAGEPYKVFTPFSRAWRALGWDAPVRKPARLPWVDGVASDGIPNRESSVLTSGSSSKWNTKPSMKP